MDFDTSGYKEHDSREAALERIRRMNATTEFLQGKLVEHARVNDGETASQPNLDAAAGYLRMEYG